MLQINFDAMMNISNRAQSPRFRLDAHQLQDDQGATVARVRNGGWQVGTDFHTRWVCIGPLDVHFEYQDGHEPQRRGWYLSVTAYGTSLSDGEEFLATLTKDHWQCHRTRSPLTAITFS